MRDDDAVDARVFRRGASSTGDVEPLSQPHLTTSYARRLDDFEIRHGPRLRNVFEHFIDADQAVAGIGDGATGGDNFD